MSFNNKKSSFNNKGNNNFKRNSKYDNKKPNNYTPRISKVQASEEEELNLIYLKRACSILDKFIKDNKDKEKADPITIYVFKELYNREFKSDTHSYEDIRTIFDILNVLINMTKGALNRKINPKIRSIRILYFFSIFDMKFPSKIYDNKEKEMYHKLYPLLFKAEYGVKLIRIIKDPKLLSTLWGVKSFVNQTKKKHNSNKKPSPNKRTNNTNNKYTNKKNNNYIKRK